MQNKAAPSIVEFIAFSNKQVSAGPMMQQTAHVFYIHALLQRKFSVIVCVSWRCRSVLLVEPNSIFNSA